MATATPNAPTPAAKPYTSDIYMATLNVKRDNKDYLNISTPLPESFSFGLNSHFDRPLDQPLSNLNNGGGALANGLVKAGATAITGQTTKMKFLSGAVWSGGSYLSISLPFLLHAYTDAKVDVMDKLIQLMSLAAPSEDGLGGTLRAPGPTVANLDAIMEGNFSQQGNPLQMGGDVITVNLGRFMTLSPCIITDVTPTFDTMFDQNGTPMGVSVNVSIETFFTTTQEDLIKAFQNSITAGTGAKSGSGWGVLNVAKLLGGN
jgi:hypothetical protein